LNLIERLDNIYTIDTNMWNFDRYMSAFLVAGKEIALIDTGEPNKLEPVLTGIKKTGYSVSDISYIFCGHCEHADHAGNVAPILRLAPRAGVYINPVGFQSLLDPNKEIARKRALDNPEVAAMRTDMEPVPASRIQKMKDGDTLDLGNGEKLTVYFTPGHQPSGITLYEHKHRGLFINDLVGNCFPDADAHYPISPLCSDFQNSIESLERLLSLQVDYLYLGHYGITDQPYPIMKKAIAMMQGLLDMGKAYVHAGKSGQIAARMLEMLDPEIKKLGTARGEKLYKYATGNHQRTQSQFFTQYCINKFS